MQSKREKIIKKQDVFCKNMMGEKEKDKRNRRMMMSWRQRLTFCTMLLRSVFRMVFILAKA